jgi:hypothetical protein
MDDERGRPAGWAWAATLLGPLAVTSLYLVLSRGLARWDTEASDLAALLLAVALGVGCIARLPYSPAVRVALAIVYVPVGGLAVWIYWVGFVGLVFGDWL